MRHTEIYDLAIKKWGIKAQITMVFEEFAELQKELCKFLRKCATGDQLNLDEIIEELVDCEIMIEQMIRYFEKTYTKEKKYVDVKWEKMKRLEERLTND
jgi:hypothetical protein